MFNIDYNNISSGSIYKLSIFGKWTNSSSKVKNPNWLETKKLFINKHSWEYELRTSENKSSLLGLKASLLPEYH